MPKKLRWTVRGKFYPGKKAKVKLGGQIEEIPKIKSSFFTENSFKESVKKGFFKKKKTGASPKVSDNILYLLMDTKKKGYVLSRILKSGMTETERNALKGKYPLYVFLPKRELKKVNNPTKTKLSKVIENFPEIGSNKVKAPKIVKEGVILRKHTLGGKEPERVFLPQKELKKIKKIKKAKKTIPKSGIQKVKANFFNKESLLESKNYGYFDKKWARDPESRRFGAVYKLVKIKKEGYVLERAREDPDLPKKVFLPKKEIENLKPGFVRVKLPDGREVLTDKIAINPPGIWPEGAPYYREPKKSLGPFYDPKTRKMITGKEAREILKIMKKRFGGKHRKLRVLKGQGKKKKKE